MLWELISKSTDLKEEDGFISQGSHPKTSQPSLPRSCSLLMNVHFPIDCDGDVLQLVELRLAPDPAAVGLVQGWGHRLRAALHPREGRPHSRPPSILLPCGTLPACPVPGSASQVARHSPLGILR